MTPADLEKMPVFHWHYENMSGEVAAYTKGEARAHIKKALGFSNKARLPSSVVIVRTRMPTAEERFLGNLDKGLSNVF
jgi:hypothetical protein